MKNILSLVRPLSLSSVNALEVLFWCAGFVPKVSPYHNVYILTLELEWWNKAPTCLVCFMWLMRAVWSKEWKAGVNPQRCAPQTWGERCSFCLDHLWVVCGSCVRHCRSVSLVTELCALLWAPLQIHRACSMLTIAYINLLYCWYPTSQWWIFHSFLFKLDFFLLVFI